MPEFLNPFPGLTPDRLMTLRELTRAIRLALSAEQEAVHLYEAIADATDNPSAKAVLQDIANEERVHAGEFLRLLSILAPDETQFLNEGAAEVDAMAAGAATAVPVTAETAAPAPPQAAPTPPSIGSLR